MWDIRYRPLVFDDVLGQLGAAQVLAARLKEGRAFDTSYIFAGGHGCGKTTLARILARAMLCQDLKDDGNPCNECSHCKGCLDETLDAFTELDAASNGTTADMRHIVDGLAYSLPGIKKRIYLLDECHRMSKEGQDVLLKAIEEKRVIAIFCTTELPKVRDTIKSRCETYEIRKIPREDILERMKMVLEKEGVEYEEEAVLTVIDIANGHVRDVLNKLETVAQLGPVTLEAVRERLNLSVVSTYYDILLSLGDATRAVSLVEEACDRVGAQQVAAGLAEAAMNSYRHAHKIHTEFIHFDKAMAAKVHEAFGDSLPNLAEYFLRLNYITQLHLICDVVRLCGSGGVPVLEAPTQATPPVTVQAALPVSTPTPAAPSETAPPATPAPEPTPEPTPTLTPTPQPAASPAPATAPSDPTKEKLKRADGIGPLGSSDPHALTSHDHEAVPPDMPRDHRREKPNLTISKNPSKESPLTPAEFRAQLLGVLQNG